jgi:hypothetical protein
LNERTVTGRIIISGERVLIYGGNIIAPAPADNATADAGVVQINASATNAQIVDCHVSAVDSTVAGVRGARGMQIDAEDVIVRNSFVQAGSSAAVGGLADGGVGIQSFANNLTLDNNQIFGGNGSESNSSIITTGNGGAGLMITAGVGVRCINSAIGGGASGNATSGADGITLASGGHGINVDAGAEVVLEQNIITGGNSGTIDGSALATVGNVIQGNGGNSIHSAALNLIVQQCVLNGGNVGSATATGASGIGGINSFTAGTGGSGIYLDTNSVKFIIQNCTIGGGDSGLVTASALGGAGINNVPLSGKGGPGIEIVQQVIDDISPSALIESCAIKGGLGTDFVSGSGFANVTSNSVFANDAGHGIVIPIANTSFVDILTCTILTSDGGSLVSSILASNGATKGGDGGNGIRLADSTGDGTGINGIYIESNVILGIGQGGDAPGETGAGGFGGYGIFIGSGVVSVLVSGNAIAFSPGGGSGGFATGGDREAILQSGGSSAVIFDNFAYDIAALLPYVMTVGDAVDAPSGTPFALAAGTNNLFNVYK